MNPIRRAFLVMALLAVPGGFVAARLSASQEATITVTGCVERDAASRAPVFKIVTSLAGGGTRIYRLDAPASVDLAGAVGKTAEASGAASTEKRAGREVHVLTVKAFKIVSDRCQ